MCQVIAHSHAVVDRHATRLVDENPQQAAPGALQQHQLVAESCEHGFKAGRQIHHRVRCSTNKKWAKRPSVKTRELYHLDRRTEREDGARNRNRTGTPSLARDFKSLVSTNFTIRAEPVAEVSG